MLLFLVACTDYNLQGEEPVKPGVDSPADSPVDSPPPPATPDIEIEPMNQDLGPFLVGAPVNAVLLIRNVGDAPLLILDISSDWSFSPDLGATALEPGAFATVVASTSALEGVGVGSLTVLSDDPDEASLTAAFTYVGEDPCSWSHWVEDGTCGEVWGGTGDDGEAALSGTFSPPSSSLGEAAAGTSLKVVDPGLFSVDDELFLWASDGRYAFVRVLAVGEALEVSPAVELPAGARVQRVPHYTNVSVSSTLSGSAVVFRACGQVDLSGTIDASGQGWSGGRRTTGIPEVGWQGASEAGSGGQSTSANGTGGGGGGTSCNVHTDGGGGGHATAGTGGGSYVGYPCVGKPGDGGGTTGDPELSTMHGGGGGGSGYLDNDATSGSFGGAGGAGGGLVWIAASEGIFGAGAVRADGADGENGKWIGGASPGGGGGGAGGTVRLLGEVGVSISAQGGKGGQGSEAGGTITYGGTGGEGRIRVDGAFAGTATPSALLTCE